MKENRLYYTSPAVEWEEALPLGNGRLGMMVFGETTEERVQINEESFWTGWETRDNYNPKAYGYLEEIRKLIFEGKYSEAEKLCGQKFVMRGGTNKEKTSFGRYQTAGDLYITAEESSEEKYMRELILDEGIAKVRFGNYKREYFVSYKYNTAVIRICGDVENISLRYEREDAMIVEDVDLNEIKATGYLPTKFCLRIRYEKKDGEMLIYIVAATSYLEEDPVIITEKTIEKAMAAGYEELLKETKEYFSEILGRSEIIFPESGTKADIPTNERIMNPDNDLGLVELYFNFGKYLLVGSSRGKLPANLQGIWNKDYAPPWSADFHANINLQMNYWNAEVSDMPELLEPFFKFLVPLSEEARESAKIHFHCNGWFLGVITNPFKHTPLGQYGWSSVYVTGGAWCIRHMKERWLYGGDKEFLKEYYPVIKGASEFFCDYLIKDQKTGYLVTAPASSPENCFVCPDGSTSSMCAGTTMDTSIIKELFEFNIEVIDTLGEDLEFKKVLQDKLSQLTPIRMGKYGQIMEWSEDFEECDPGHRHISHLYALYPANQITKSTPELFEGAKKTIERRLSNGGGHTGWSRAWIINFYARLADGNAAYENILQLFKKSTLPNMFDNHPPFQIDGNFGGSAGIAEMLIQSHDGYIELLPALPDAWKDGEFNGLMARGGFKVSAKWKDGKIAYYNIKGKEGSTCNVKFNGKTETVKC